jgi:hypothetical protein
MKRERALNQEFQFQTKINEMVVDLGITLEEAKLLYLQQEGEFENVSLAYQCTLGHCLLETEGSK